jgi:hypothetical protein
MEIWNYHPSNKELLWKSNAVPSPLEPGEFLIPAYATTTKPPEAILNKQVYVFNDGSWSVVDDHRGEIWWKPSGESVTIEEIGSEVINGLLSEKPVIELLPPPVLTAEEKLAAVGLTVDELKALIAG